MSTLNVEFLKQENSSSNNVTLDSDGSVAINRHTSDGTIIDLQKAGTSVGTIGTSTSYTNQLEIKSSSSNLILNANGSNYSFDAVQFYPLTSGRSLGLASNPFNNLYLSGGVYLGGTGAANLMDYYEEGTSTIGISAASGSGGTISGGAMSWTRIGNQVIVAGNFSVSSLGTLSGAFFITGFPFTSSANFLQSQGAVRSQGIGGANDIPVVIEMLSGTSNARMHFLSGSSTQRTVQVSDISVSDFMAFGLTYQI